MRVLLSLLLIGASWQPSEAAVVAGAARRAPATPGIAVSPVNASPYGLRMGPERLDILLTLPAGAMPAPAPGLAPDAAQPILSAAMSAPAPLPPAVSARRPAPGVAPLAANPAAPSAFAAAAKISDELLQSESLAAPGSGASAKAKTAEGEILDRFFDGIIQRRTVETVVDAAAPATNAGPRRLGKPALPAAPAPAAAVATQPRLMRHAVAATTFYKFGMESLSIAMPLVLLSFFSSMAWMVAIAGLGGLCMAAASIGSGGIIDRHPVEKVMAASLIAGAAAIGGMIASLALGAASPGLIIPLYAAANVAQGVASTARDALPARLLGQDEAVLNRFNAKLYLGYQISAMLVPLMVGLLISQAGVLAGLAVLPPAYLLAAWAFSRLQTLPADSRPHDLGSGLKATARQGIRDLKEGARIIMSSKETRWLAVVSVGSLLLLTLIKLLLAPLFAKDVVRSPAISAWISGGANLGELLGAALLLKSAASAGSAQGSPLLRWMRVLIAASLGIWAFASGSLWLILPAVVAVGLSYATNSVAVTSYLQSRLPQESLGKALGFLSAAGLLILMLAAFLFGILFELLPTATGLIAACAGLSALAALFYKSYAAVRAARSTKT